LLLAAGAAVWQGPSFVQDLGLGQTQVVDFFQEWASARNWREGEPIYADQRETCKRYLGFEQAKEDRFVLDVNAHPPTAVLLALPLAWLSYPQALLVWNLLSIAALALTLVLLARTLEVSLPPWLWLALAPLILFVYPFREQVHEGQLNLLLLLLLTAVWVSDRAGKPVLAGAFLAAAVAIKLFPAVLFLYFLLRRQWTLVLAGLLWLLFFEGLTVAVLGWSTSWTYGTEVIPRISEWRSMFNNSSPAGFWSKLFDPGPKGFVIKPLVYSPFLARACTLVSSLVILGVLVWRVPWAQTRAEMDRGFALAVLAMLLLTPLVWEHSFLLLVLPVFLLFVKAPSLRSGLVGASLVLVPPPTLFYWLFMGGPWGNWVWPIVTPWLTVTALSIQLYALLALFVVGVWATRPGGSRSSVSPQGGPAGREPSPG
jgi:hypothetical protein